MKYIKLTAVSDQGAQRDSNEDMISVNGELLRDDALSIEIPLVDDGITYVLVADGMGGHEKGEFASEYTLQQIKNNISSIFNFEKQFPELIEWIGNDLNRKAQEEGQERPMGCTLTGIVWFRGKIWIVNAGDSRTYRYRSEILKQLTEDEDMNHKMGQDMGAQGLALYNCIGGGCTSQITLQDYTGKVLPEDKYIICSDGVSDMISDDALESLVGSDATAEDIVKTANENGGVDNISIIYATILEKEEDSQVEEVVETIVIEGHEEETAIEQNVELDYVDESQFVDEQKSAKGKTSPESGLISRLSNIFKGKREKDNE